MELQSINLAEELDFGLVNLNIRPSLCRVEAGGVHAHVEPKVMELLIVLARAQGNTVTRDQLINICWGGRIVSDDALTRTLGKARKLGALTMPPAFKIETLPKVGVRLICDRVGHTPHDAGSTRSPTTAHQPLLIVFPFENLSLDPDLQFFSDGVSDEILSQLIRGSNLKVIGRATSSKVDGADKFQVAQALRATHIVDGSIRRFENRVRINVHVTEIALGTGVWADQIERSLGDIFALQDDIANGVARALSTAFEPSLKAPIDPAVYDLYLRARDLETDPGRLLASISSLERVTQVAPDFADGWGRLATLRALRRMNMPYQDRDEITELLRHDIAKCHALDRDNPQANYASYWLTAPFGEFLEQEAIIQKTLRKRNPLSDDFAIASFHCYNVGRFQQAHDYAAKAYSFDPSSWAVSINHAISLWQTSGAEACRDALRQHVDAWPLDQQGTAYLLVLSIWLKDWVEVDRLTDPKRLAQFPFREHTGFLLTAGVLRYPSQENQKFLLDMVVGRADRTGAVDCSVWAILAFNDLTSQAYERLGTKRIGPIGAKSDMLGMMGYRPHTLFTPLNTRGRDDPRFVTLCARLGLVDYWLETERWPDCADEVPYDFRQACEESARVAREPFAM
jgi:TolB-like protein